MLFQYRIIVEYKYFIRAFVAFSFGAKLLKNGANKTFFTQSQKNIFNNEEKWTPQYKRLFLTILTHFEKKEAQHTGVLGKTVNFTLSLVLKIN